MKHETVAVGTSAVHLTNLPDTRNQNDISRSILVTNEGTANVFLGGEGVTSTQYGYKLAAGASISFDLTRGDRLYAISTAANQTVRLLHAGV